MLRWRGACIRLIRLDTLTASRGYPPASHSATPTPNTPGTAALPTTAQPRPRVFSTSRRICATVMPP